MWTSPVPYQVHSARLWPSAGKHPFEHRTSAPGSERRCSSHGRPVEQRRLTALKLTHNACFSSRLCGPLPSSDQLTLTNTQCWTGGFLRTRQSQLRHFRQQNLARTAAPKPFNGSRLGRFLTCSCLFSSATASGASVARRLSLPRDFLRRGPPIQE